MAIFYCDVSHGSRKTGQSGAAKVDYIMRTGKYGRDPGEVIGACAGHLPRWAGGNPRVFFAAADEYERSNGRLFTQVMFAIPNELSDADSLLLAYHFAEAVTGNGAPYAVAVHRGGVEAPDGETADAAPQEADVVSAAAADEADLPPHNRHGHLMFSERIDDGLERTAREWFRRANKKEPALGGAAKDRTMNGGNWVPEVRHLCADYINYALERAGLPGRVTCESHETRIARAEAAGDEETAERLRLNPPGIHLGPTAWAIEQGRPGRPGRPSWRGDLNRLIAAEGEELRGNVEALNAQLNQLDVREAAVTEKLEAARRVAAAQFGQREEALQGTSVGKEILHAVRAEMIGESAAPRSVVQLGELLEVAEERFGAALDLREAGFRETSVGSRYLADASSSVVGQEGSPTLYQREAIITTAETRLGRELDAREASLQEGADGAQLLLEVRHEHAEEYGPAPKLAQREQLITAAEARLRAHADADRAAQRDLDEREEALRSLSIGSELLAAAEQELLGEGKRSGMLAARAAVVGDAERRADEALEGREEALRSRSLGERDGEPTAPAIDGAWLYASKLAELEAGRRQRVGLLDRGGREQALVWAEQQMDRLDALHEAEAPYPFFGDLSELGPSRRPTEIEELLDYAEAQQCAAAACRQERVDALSGDEWVYFEEKLDALDPRRGETGTPRPTHVDAAVDYARARVVALDEEIEGRRAVIEQTPGDGHARLLAAGFGEASRQQKIAALSVMETDLAEDFARREKRVRSDVAGVEFLRRGRLEVLGDAGRQPETLPERGGVIVAAEAYQRHAVQRRRAEAERRETRHQSISDTPDGAARLGAAGWDEARTDGERDQVLAIVERGLAADFERREEALRRDETGEALLRRGRLEVLEADREAATLAERGRILERAEAERQEEERQRAEERRTRVARQETDVRATKKGPGWLHEAAERVRQGADRALTLEERERIVEMVSGWIRKDLDRRQKELRSNEQGAGFLDAAQRSIGAVTTLAAEEQFVEAAEKQHRQYQEAQARRRARQLELWRKPGGKDLYYAALTGLDPQRRPGGKTAVKNIDVSLAAAESDDERLGLLRDVLADPAEAARYREALEACGETFTVPDIDAAVDAVLRERAAAERERKAEARRTARLGALSPAGRELHAAWLASLSSAGHRGDGPSGADVDRALEATASDAHLPRLEAVFGDDEQLSYYRVVLGAPGGEVTLQQIDEALEATEMVVRRKQTVFEYPGNSEHPAGSVLYTVAVESRAPGWRSGAEIGSAAVFDDALTDVESQLAVRVRQAADELDRSLLPTTRPYPRSRFDYRVPALSDARLDGLDELAAARGGAFIQATVTEVRERYARRARYDTRDEERYGPGERFESERTYLADVVEMTWDRETRLWSASGSGPRPTRASALARVLKQYLAKVWAFFQVACDKVLGGNLGERLHRRREQVERAADVAERLLTPSVSGRGLSVPPASDKALAGVVTDKNREAIEDVVEAVWERFHHRSRHESYEHRYDADDRDKFEARYLATALEITQVRQKRAWLRSSSPSPRPPLALARRSVLEEHQSYLREIFEVAYDEVFGRGEDAARWRRERDQVRRAVDVAEAGLSTTTFGHRHVPALSDDTLDDSVAAETDPFIKKMYSLAWERCYCRASGDTPYEERYDADDRRRSELAHLDDVIRQTHDRQLKSWLSSSTVSARPTLASARESVLKDYRAHVRGIFTAARDEVLRNDELQDREREQDVGPDRAAPEPPLQNPSASPGQERKPHSEEQEQERAGQDSTTGRSNQGERPRATAVPVPGPASVSVTEADRLRLAKHIVAGKLPRTEPYAGNPSHRPPAFSDERFNRVAAASGDTFVKKVVAGVQKEQTYYTARERAESEEEYLRPIIDRQHQDALVRHEAAEAKRKLFRRRPPKPTWAEAKVAAIQKFETEHLDVIEKVCREVRRRTPAAVRRELARFEPERQVSIPQRSRLQTHATEQQDRGDSGLVR